MDDIETLWLAPGRGLALSPWVGTHPDDDDRFAHLLIHPRRSDLADAMLDLATDLEMRRNSDAAGEPTAIPVSKGWCSIAEVDNRTHAVVYRPQGGLAHPVDELWVDAARQRECVLLTVGLDQMDVIGRLADLDAYLRTDSTRLFAGFLYVT